MVWAFEFGLLVGGGICRPRNY